MLLVETQESDTLHAILTCLIRQKLGEAFFSLPDEITVQILCYLSQTDIFALRLTSRSVYSFLHVHARPITRSLLIQSAYEHASCLDETSIPHEKAGYTYSYIQTLYPPPLPCASMDYLLQMVKRQAQVDRMLLVTVNFLQMKIYMIPSCPRFEDFKPYRMRLVRRMHLAAWTIYHFLEKFREMLLFDHPKHPPLGTDPSDHHEPDESGCPSCTDFVRCLLPTYPGTEIIPAYHFYDLCRQHLRSLTREPMYSGSFERRLRGRSRKPPTPHDLAQYIIFGGIPELAKLSMLKGTYHERIEVINSFVDKVACAAAPKGNVWVLNSSSTPSSSQTPVREDVTFLPRSFHTLGNPLRLPLDSVSPDIISAVPQLDRFIIDSEDWLLRMFQLVKPEDQIVSAFGFVQNILAGKQEPEPPRRSEGETSGHREGEASGHQEGEASDHQEGGSVEDGDLDYLAPVRGFD